MNKILQERKENCTNLFYQSLVSKPVVFWRTEKNVPCYMSEDSINKTRKKKSLLVF